MNTSFPAIYSQFLLSQQNHFLLKQVLSLACLVTGGLAIDFWLILMQNLSSLWSFIYEYGVAVYDQGAE